MADWSASMQQTFEFYVVDPGTWKDTKRLNTVKSCKINRDAKADTLGSAALDVYEPIGECYVRVYLVVNQNGMTEKIPLGTFLVQTPSSDFDGKVQNIMLDAYTPLIELKENPIPIGYYAPKSDYYEVSYDGSTYTKTGKKLEVLIGTVVKDAKTVNGNEQVFKTFDAEPIYYCRTELPLELVYRLTREHLRAPVVKTESDKPLITNVVADTSDTWYSFLTTILAQQGYTFDLDELSRVIFSPSRDVASLQPVWTYDDGNSSILYPEFSTSHDLYGIPNVVEVIYYHNKKVYTATARNEDETSPTSVQSRGREIIHRVIDPQISGTPSQEELDSYAERLLKSLSTVEYTITYSHGYCPVRLFDCVRLNYERAGLYDVKAKVISQSIECKPGCKVTEKAIFTKKLWR